MSWWETQPGRYDLELALVQEQYPAVAVEKVDGRLTMTTLVEIQVKPFAKPRRHTLEISVPDNYPERAPKVFVKDLHFPKTSQGPLRRPKHLYPDDSLCLYYPNDPRHLRWLPEDGLLTLVLWAERWLRSYYVWTFRNHWLGESAH